MQLLDRSERELLERMSGSPTIATSVEHEELCVVLENGRLFVTSWTLGPGGEWKEMLPVPGTEAANLLRRKSRETP
jgi:hypothetical protein